MEKKQSREKKRDKEEMKLWVPLLATLWPKSAEARFDLASVEPEAGLQCPPQCTCSRWTCIDEIDLSYIQSLISGPVSLLKDHEVDQQFKCWKTCCKKQGVQVSVCEHNQCQKCCNSECTDIKSMIRTRRKFSSSKCNKCLESKCNHDQEYTSVMTSRSCRGLFNKYTTPFNSSVTFQVEAHRDLRIFLYDEPLNLMRQTLRERRDASQMEDLLDDTIENELIDNKINHLLSEIHNRVKRELESMREQKQREREQIREQAKKLNKKKRERKRERKNEQKNKYGMAPVNREPVDEKMLDDLKFGNSENSKNSETQENFEDGYDNADARSRDRPVYEYEPEYESEYEETESFQMENANYDCRDHIDSMSREERKECNQKIKDLWRQERMRLKQKSKTYRELKPALENPLIMMEALNRTLETKMDFTTISDDERADKDDALEKYLHLYGYNDDNASNAVFQAVFKSQAQLLYEQNQEKVKSKNMDTADWTRPHIMREVPLTTLGSLYVNDKIDKEEEKRELRKASKSTYEFGRSIKFEDSSVEDVEATFSERLGENFRSLEEGFADEESGFHGDILESGWIQIGIGSSNNTAADLKSCQNSSYKRCIGVLRKNFPNLLQGDKPQEVTVSVQGSGTERILTVDIQTKDESDKKRIFEVLIDDPTIASLKHMAICTTKGSRGKIGLFKDEEERAATTPNVNYMTTFRRMVDCQFSCLASNCREECMPDTKCEQCLVENCGKYTSLNDMPENLSHHA